MRKKKKPSAITDDPVSCKAMRDGIKQLFEKNFSLEIPRLTDEDAIPQIVLQIGEAFEQVAKGFKNLAASWKAPAK